MADEAEPMFDPTVKKKKKKQAPSAESAAAAPEVDDELEADFNAATKKKKKQKALDVADSVNVGPADAAADAGESGGDLAADSGDYTYADLLARAFRFVMERNPDNLSEKRKVVMKPPSLMRVGTKRTAFVNFAEICKQIQRKQEHLLAYLLTELGTTGSVDGNNQLIIRGRFQTKNIESVLRSYIKEYVMCHTCRSHDTELVKETRLFFLQCATCGSRCSVASIKSGFQAQVGRRAAMRAKAT